jgi:hypothetical protein
MAGSMMPPGGSLSEPQGSTDFLSKRMTSLVMVSRRISRAFGTGRIGRLHKETRSGARERIEGERNPLEKENRHCNEKYSSESDQL